MSRVRGESRATLLVSFCNVKQDKPVVAAVGLESESTEVKWIRPGDIFLRGATGMCFWQDLICVVHQGGPKLRPGFMLLDPVADFGLVSGCEIPSDSPPDLHSVCSVNDELYIVSSGKDSVYRATFDDSRQDWSVSLYWTRSGSSGVSDESHVNGIECIGGELHVSGLGKKESDSWKATKQGFVYNIARDEYMMDDLHHPHSLFAEPNGDSTQTFWTCESAKKRLRSSDERRYDFSISTGYIRGLVVKEDTIYAGLSKARKGSKSSGNLETYEGECRVYEIPRDLEKERELVNFSEARNEIYELLLL